MNDLSDGSVSDATGTHLLVIVTSGLSRDNPYIRIAGCSLLGCRHHDPKGCEVNEITRIRSLFSGRTMAVEFVGTRLSERDKVKSIYTYDGRNAQLINNITSHQIHTTHVTRALSHASQGDSDCPRGSFLPSSN